MFLASTRRRCRRPPSSSRRPTRSNSRVRCCGSATPSVGQLPSSHSGQLGFPCCRSFWYASRTNSRFTTNRSWYNAFDRSTTSIYIGLYTRRRCSRDRNGEEGSEQQHLDYGRFRYSSEVGICLQVGLDLDQYTQFPSQLFVFLSEPHHAHLFLLSKIAGILIIDQPPSRFYTHEMLYHYIFRSTPNSSSFRWWCHCCNFRPCRSPHASTNRYSSGTSSSTLWSRWTWHGWRQCYIYAPSVVLLGCFGLEMVKVDLGGRLVWSPRLWDELIYIKLCEWNI